MTSLPATSSDTVNNGSKASGKAESISHCPSAHYTSEKVAPTSLGMSLFLDAPFPTGTDRCCLSRAESLRCTPLPIYVGPRRSGQSMPPVPSPQVYAESAESFGLVIIAGSNLLRLHFRQRLPSAGPTHPCEGQSNCALFPGQCQSRKDRHPSHQRPCVRLLPRPTALPPYAI